MFLLDIAEQAEVVRGVVGWTDFDAADGVARINAMAAQKLLVGLRPMVQDIPDDDWLLGPGLTPLLTAMARNDLIFDALVKPRHLPRFSCKWPAAIPICNSCSIIAPSRRWRPATLQFGAAILRGSPNTPTSSVNCRDWRRRLHRIGGPRICVRQWIMSLRVSGHRACCGEATGRWSILPAAMQNGSLPPKACWRTCRRTKRPRSSAVMRRASIWQNADDGQVESDRPCVPTTSRHRAE